MLRRSSKSAPPPRDTPPSPLLNTPAQNDYQNPKLELREKTVKKWLATLPILNPVISIPALLERLNGLNQRIAGCQLTRPIPELIDRAGFDVESLESRYVEGMPRFTGYCYYGVATTRSA